MNAKVTLFCCNRIAPSIELGYLIRAFNSDQKNAIALIESMDLLNRLEQNTFGRAVTILLPKLLNQFGPITLPRIVGAIGRACRVFGGDILADYFATLRGIVAGEVALSRLIKEFNVCTVVIADDRSLGWDIGVVSAANRRGIKTVTVPFALSDPEADWVHRINRTQFDLKRGSWLARYLKRRLAHTYAANVCRKTGRELMFLTVGQVLALRACNALPVTPWAYGGGITDVAAVYGTSLMNKQIKLGVKSEKLVVTGQCSMDQLFKIREKREQLRTNLAKEMQINMDAPIIICAVPPYHELGLMLSARHWELTVSMVRDLRQTGANLVLSLHPRSQPSEYAEIAARYGAVIAKYPLIEILPIADLFVASHSSTVRWAILLAIPILLLDDFNVGASGLFDSGGVFLANNRAGLRECTDRLLNDENEKEKMRLCLSQQGSGLDPFDGKNTQRLVKLLATLAASESKLGSSILSQTSTGAQWK